MAETGEITFGVVGTLENGETWFLTEVKEGFLKRTRIKEVVEGEIIEESSEVIVS